MRPQRGMYAIPGILHRWFGRRREGLRMRRLRVLRWRSAAVGALIVATSLAGVPPLIAAQVKKPVVQPVLFSADRTGRTPVQDELVSAAASAAAKHRPLLVPKGRYLITSRASLPRDVTVRLAPGAMIVGALPGSSLLQLNRGSTLTGGTIRNDATTDAFDVDLGTGATSVRIVGVHFAGARTNSVYINNPGIRDLRITDCSFSGVVYGVLLNAGAIDANGVKVLRNTFTGVAADAVEINAATGGTAKRARNITVSDNVMRPGGAAHPSGGFGVGLAGVNGFTVSRNRITGAGEEGVHIEDRSSNGVVRENSITGGGVGYRPAIAVYRTSSNILITRNKVSRFAGDGIAVLWDSLGSSRSVQVKSNAISDVSRSGISVGGDSGTGPFKIDRNVIYNARGSAIAVLGSHHFSSVSNNLVVGRQDAVIFTKYQGAGLRVTTANRLQRAPSQSFTRRAAQLKAGAPAN